MKKIFSLAAAMLLTVGAAFAQDNYNRLQVSYVSYKMTNSEMGDKEINPKGVNLGSVWGFLVSDVQPVFVETGLNLTWAHSAVDYQILTSKGEFKYTYMNVAIPLNGVYKYEVNDKVAFSGHAGLNFKVNMMGKSHSTITEEITGYVDKQTLNWLSKKDMGSRDDRASIFQLGGQVGCGMHFSNLYIGYQFQMDFMKFQQSPGDDSHKWNTQFITLGVTM